MPTDSTSVTFSQAGVAATVADRPPKVASRQACKMQPTQRHFDSPHTKRLQGCEVAWLGTNKISLEVHFPPRRGSLW
jgi:hypothetical protein